MTTINYVSHFDDDEKELYFLCSSEESYRNRRDLFKFLPLGFGFGGMNDLETGSWWFVIGSAISALIPLIPLLDNEYGFFGQGDSEEDLEALNENATWIILFLSGVCFTLGSYGFVRAFKEPAVPRLRDKLCPNWQKNASYCHCMRTDEILASWLFLLGAFPSLPYAIIYLAASPWEIQYWCGFLAALIFVVASALFVWSVYILPPLARNTFIPTTSSAADTIESAAPNTTGSTRSDVESDDENDRKNHDDDIEQSLYPQCLRKSDAYTHVNTVEREKENKRKQTRNISSEVIDFRSPTSSVSVSNPFNALGLVPIASTTVENETGMKNRNNNSNEEDQNDEGDGSRLVGADDNTVKVLHSSPLKCTYLVNEVTNLVGEKSLLLLHANTDFKLAAIVLYLCCVAWLIGAFVILCVKIQSEPQNERLIYVYLSSFLDAIPFVIASMYYISGASAGFLHTSEDKTTKEYPTSPHGNQSQHSQVSVL